MGITFDSYNSFDLDNSIFCIKKALKGVVRGGFDERSMNLLRYQDELLHSILLRYPQFFRYLVKNSSPSNKSKTKKRKSDNPAIEVRYSGNALKNVALAVYLVMNGEIKSSDELQECFELQGQFSDRVISKIGEGGTRNVYKISRERWRRVLALKVDKYLDDIINPRAREVLEATKSLSSTERVALFELTHANLARMYDFGNLKDGRSYIIEEYVNGKTLEDIVSGGHILEPLEFVRVFAPLVSALNYLASKGYVHRDIKPNNILISDADFKVKLTDFQTAVKIDTEDKYLGLSYGSFRVAAPELIRLNTASNASDIYSLGCCMYYALFGDMPYDYTALKVLDDPVKIKEKFDLGDYCLMEELFEENIVALTERRSRLYADVETSIEECNRDINLWLHRNRKNIACLLSVDIDARTQHYKKLKKSLKSQYDRANSLVAWHSSL